MRIPFQDKQKVEPFQPNEQTALLDAASQYASKMVYSRIPCPTYRYAPRRAVRPAMAAY